MPTSSERRSQADRRKAARGGRRPHDQPGSTPLVLVVGHGADPEQQSATILRDCRFAVAPAVDVPEALRVIDGVHPDLIVAGPEEAAGLRGTGLPIVEYASGDAEGGGLVERLREALRKRRGGGVRG